MEYLPSSKNNYLAFHGLTGYLWCNSFSTKDMCEKLGLTPEQWDLIVDESGKFTTTYSERCNATDFFKENIKSDSEFVSFWDGIKNGKSDFEFSKKAHSPVYVGRVV